MVTTELLGYTVHSRTAPGTANTGMNLETCSWKIHYKFNPGNNFTNRR